MPDFSLDQSIIEQLLPLGDSIITGVVTLGTAFITYVVGRSSRSSEVKHLEEEKKNLVASNVVDNSEVVAEAMNSMVGPLLERVAQQRREIRSLEDYAVQYRNEIRILEDEIDELKRKKEKE